MDVRPLLRPSLGAAAATLLLAACAGGGSQLAPSVAQGPSAQSRAVSPMSFPRPLSLADVANLHVGRNSGLAPVNLLDPAVVKPQMYVSQYGQAASLEGQVNDYGPTNKKNKKPLCIDPDLNEVNGIEVDSSNELWIPMETLQGVSQVVSQAPHCGKAGVTLTDPNGEPADIAWNTKSGITYVSDIVSNGSNAGDISVYPKGATSPNSKLTYSGVFVSVGVAVDSKGNVYQSYFSSLSGGAGGVVEFAGGKMPGKPLKTVSQTVTVPGTITLDKNDNMIITNQTTDTLYVYAPPYTKAPTSSFSLQGQSVQCSLNKAATDIACADASLNEVDVYAWPAGTYQYSFNKGLNPSTQAIGIAQDPPEN
jgi:hypothetical protein